MTSVNSEFISKNEIVRNVKFYFREYAINTDEKSLDQSFSKLKTVVTDTVLIKTLQTSYLKEKGRLYYLKQEFSKAYSYIDSSYFLEPSDKEVEQMFIDLFSALFCNTLLTICKSAVGF